MSESKKSLDQQLVEWLEKQGYPLEMFTAQIFQEAGFHVGMSGFYTDFEANQPREIDVTAQLLSTIDKPVAVQVSYHIECKLARDKPWVIFVPEAQPERFLPMNVVASRVIREYLHGSLRILDIWRQINRLPLFQFPYLGYGVTQAFTTGQDVPYQAVMGAVKAAVGRALQADEFPENEKQAVICSVSFPIIVIDGRLFECRINEAGQLGTTETKMGVVHWKSPNPTHSHPLVYVVTKSYLTDFIDMATMTAKGFIQVVEEQNDDFNNIVKRVRTERSQFF